MKGISFIGRSLEDLRSFPLSAKRDAGYQLDRVQRGLEPNDWKPMTTVGSGVKEIRIKDEDGIYRIIYVAKYQETIFVLHAFMKKSQKTETKDINIAKNRLKALLTEIQK